MVVSTQDPQRITPSDQLELDEDKRIAYFVRPGTPYDQAKFKQRVAAQGAQFVADDALRASLRRGLAVMLGDPADADQLAKCLALVDEAEPYLLAAERVLTLLREGAAVDAVLEAQSEARMPDDLSEQLDHLQLIVASGYPPFAAKQAAREYYMQIAPIEAFRMFVTGVKNATFTIDRASDGVTEASLLQVPPDHRREVGFAAINFMYLSRGEEKNSHSPSPTTSTPGSSATALSGPQKTPRRKTKAGASKK